MSDIYTWPIEWAERQDCGSEDEKRVFVFAAMFLSGAISEFSKVVDYASTLLGMTQAQVREHLLGLKEKGLIDIKFNWRGQAIISLNLPYDYWQTFEKHFLAMIPTGGRGGA